MATYKVPQDVEAEDKLLGPLTFKQFIFMLIAAGGGLLMWLAWEVHPLLIVMPLPIVVIFGGLAIFRREDQPVERYLLSFFNFLIRPRKRIWNTEGYYEHLVLVQRKKEEPVPLKQDIRQVHGQLEKLAQTVDTRGWSTKRPELTVPNTTATIGSQDDDRLFMPNKAQEPAEVHEREDMMSEENPEGAQLDNLLHEQTRQRREQVMENVRQQAQNQTAASEQDSSVDNSDTQNARQQAGGEPAIEPEASNQPSRSHQQSQQPDSQTQHAQQPSDTQSSDGQAGNVTQQSGILDVSDELSVSQIAQAANRQSDDTVQEGEEVQLR